MQRRAALTARKRLGAPLWYNLGGTPGRRPGTPAGNRKGTGGWPAAPVRGEVVCRDALPL